MIRPFQYRCRLAAAGMAVAATVSLGGIWTIGRAHAQEAGEAIGQEETPAANRAGGIRVTSEHGFWKIICETPPGASAEQCGMHQSVRDEDREELGLSITVLRPADRQGDLLRIQAPLGILLPTGIGLEIDGQDIGTAFFVRCFADGCWADVNVDAKLLNALSTGKRAIFKVFPTPEEGVGIPVELDGFAEAYQNLS